MLDFQPGVLLKKETTVRAPAEDAVREPPDPASDPAPDPAPDPNRALGLDSDASSSLLITVYR